MIELKKCRKLFLDFDGVIVDSNKFKELAIKNSIFKLFGKNKRSIEAINYFNKNAGISRKKKLSLFFEKELVNKIMEIYSEECFQFFLAATPSLGLKEFLKFINNSHNQIQLYILSGGEEKEIKLFLEKNLILKYFEKILASNKTKLAHLQKEQVTESDIFIGDSQNDLKVSLKSGISFILFEEHKSLESFPTEDLIKNNVHYRTQNFQSLMKKIIQ